MANYTVRKLKLKYFEQLNELAHAAGELYSQTLVSFWRTVRKKNVWLSGYTMEKWLVSNKLHAHSSDAVTQSFFASLKSWRARRKTDPNSRPPRRRRWYYKLTWKSSAIKLKDGKLRLSNGKGNQPLIVNWCWDKPKQVELGWNKGNKCYELRACYSEPKVRLVKNGRVSGCDLGEIHPMVFTDGVDTDILNGRLLRSKRQYQNKLKAKLSNLIDTKKRGSQRRQKIIKSKQKQLAKVVNQIKDIEHKLTSKAVSMLQERSIQTLVIGDVRDIRKNIKYSKKVNQKLHQWNFGSIRAKLEYKCAKAGINTELISEAYTSQEYLSCRKRNKPRNREYKCLCGFRWHRDGVGCSNIRAKYLGEIPVVGLMASPSGVRFEPHLQCNPKH
ncbi:RNA-guided endonuclease TnpB family protein [Pleurocapsa sp. PCC 7319]|uniref:RNA-guided endonuclease InsQ/TnpB family protein n=1 Tax=Pleurocapsa sp. PCC 7319 TaxID=118161 RepID=UPI0004782CA6|nr:RNA-guided endonuclease TnpB family protein [Pleurocapsa sp. PCC 7319]